MSPTLYEAPEPVTKMDVNIENVSATSVIFVPLGSIISVMTCSPLVNMPFKVFLSIINSNGKPKFNRSVIIRFEALSIIAVAPDVWPVIFYCLIG